ncbi:MAG: 7-cyano-7-deazaguanine/7-aminomethyl-7-deazaguanine transporter, partial [Neisseria sicca]
FFLPAYGVILNILTKKLTALHPAPLAKQTVSLQEN